MSLFFYEDCEIYIYIFVKYKHFSFAKFIIKTQILIQTKILAWGIEV